MKKHDYDVIVVGGGGAGITAAFTAKGLGKKTVVIEQDKLGGECTWSGCIPSKALIKASSKLYDTKQLHEYGLKIKGENSIDSSNIMNHVQEIINSVYEEESPDIFEKKGIKTIKGYASFIDRHTLEINGHYISANNIILATGTYPFVPPIEGIENITYLTNETVFKLEELPKSIMVLGAGAIGIELSQALSRLGVEVTIVLRSENILSKEDEELVEIITKELENEKINILNNTNVDSVLKKEKGVLVRLKDNDNNKYELEFESVFIATGRRPNLDGLKLDRVNIKYSKNGIIVNDKLQTSVKNVFACGDIIGPYRFSHMAEYQGITAALNTTLPIKRKVKYDDVLWCTFTDPELAHIGLTEKEARNKYGNSIRIYKQYYKDLDRAKTDNRKKGLAKIICNKKGKVIGAHILGERAGEIIHEVQIIKSLDIPLAKLQSVIHAYPTYSDIIRKISREAYLEQIQENTFIMLIRKFYELWN